MIGFDPYSGTRGRFKAPELVDLVADAGYDAINLIATEDFLPPGDEDLLRRTEERLEARGLSVPTFYFTRDDLVLLPGGQEQVRQWTPRALELAQRFNAPNIGVGTWAIPEGATRCEQLTALSDTLAFLAEEAAGVGRVVSVEFETKGALTDCYSARKFILDLDPRLRLTVDTYHMFTAGTDFQAGLTALEGLVGEVHLSGSDRGEPGAAGDECDYAGLMRGLREIGYDGPLVLQYAVQDLESLGRASRFARDLVSG